MQALSNEAHVDLAHLQQWVGREQVVQDLIAPFPARAMAGLLDRAGAPVEGEPLPLPWHWLYFLEAPARSSTGSDGHPARGGFLPPVPLPRRMWAAGQMQVQHPLVIGLPATKRSTVKSVTMKEGKTGPLVFVSVTHEITQSGQTCLSETQDIVYRDAPAGPATLPAGEVATPGSWDEALTPDAPMLFRFSALTYNGHRIHYDRGYATDEEFYPALVVHGPLQATLLLELLSQRIPGAQVREFKFRAQRPLFDSRQLRLGGHADGSKVRLWTADDGNCVGMHASAELE